jgi:hypothetical protein
LTKYRIRANSLSALRDSIAAARTIFGPALPRQAAASLVDAAPHLKKYGITVVQNGRAWHLYEDWPGMDRRKVSGSLWDGRQPMSTAPWVGKVRCAHTTWQAAAQQMAASRGVQLFQHGGMGAAWLDGGPAGDALRRLKAAALDRGAPVPLRRQHEALAGRSSVWRSYLIERGVEYAGAAIGHGGATSGQKQSVTKAMGRHNAAICDARDADAELIAWCDRQERELYTGVRQINGQPHHLFGPPRPHWDILVDRWMNPRGSSGGPRVIGTMDDLFDPDAWITAAWMRADDASWSFTLPFGCSGNAISPVLRRWSDARKARTAALLLDATEEIASRPAFSDRVIPSSPQYRAMLGEVRAIHIKDRAGRPKSPPVNKVPGPIVRTIVVDKPGALFDMRKADMAAAARVIGHRDRPDLYWPPPRSIPHAAPRHEIFVMKAVENVQSYAIAA